MGSCLGFEAFFCLFHCSLRGYLDIYRVVHGNRKLVRGLSKGRRVIVGSLFYVTKVYCLNRF